MRDTVRTSIILQHNHGKNCSNIGCKVSRCGSSLMTIAIRVAPSCTPGKSWLRGGTGVREGRQWEEVAEGVWGEGGRVGVGWRRWDKIEYCRRGSGGCREKETELKEGKWEGRKKKERRVGKKKGRRAGKTEGWRTREKERRRVRKRMADGIDGDGKEAEWRWEWRRRDQTGSVRMMVREFTRK